MTTTTVWYYQCGHGYWAYSRKLLELHLKASYKEFIRWGWTHEAIGPMRQINITLIDDEDDNYIG